MNPRTIIMPTILALAPVAAAAQSVSFRAEASASARVFPHESLFEGQASSPLSPSLVFTPSVVLESAGGAWSLLGEGFVRVDAHDGNRSHMDVRELGLQYLGDSFAAFVGVGQVFWGVTEVVHLVDIVNQVDFVEDLDGEDKLGQPMVSVTLEGGWGALDLYYLPYFRERSFPAEDGRLRGPLPIGEEAVFTSDQGRWHPGFAARVFRTVGALDIGLSAFRGTSREPTLVPERDGPGTPVVRPHYDVIDQIGLDAQWTSESTLWKLEAITRGGHQARLYALSAGVEHTMYQIFGSDGDLGILGEVMLDSRSPAAPPTIFEHDVFIGGRWARNDAAATSVLGGPVVDLRSGEALWLLEVERRVGSDWQINVEARLFQNADAGSLVHGLRKDGFISMSLTRFF